MEDFYSNIESDRFVDDLIVVPMHRHDYGDNCFSFGYDLSSDKLLELPLIEGFHFEESVNRHNECVLHYCDKNGIRKDHPFEDVANYIKEDDEHLIGTIKKPYQFFDCCEQFMIVDRGDYVCVLDFKDIASPLATGFRVKREEYYKAYNDYLISKGIDPVKIN